MAEPTGVLDFGDLILEAAIEAGTAYYGATGDEAAQVPVDAHDLAAAKRHVNNAVRMFINDAPPNGWRWTHKVASTVLWATVDLGGDISGGAYDAANDQTTLTATTATFYPTMELHDIVMTATGTFAMKSYTSSTVMIVTGDASAASSDTFSITADGDYTLAEDFGGEFYGRPTYASDTNQAVNLRWADESTIRKAREDNVETDYPRLLAPRPNPDTARRWEMIVYPTPGTDVTVEFPYNMEFALLSAVTDSLPSPRLLDEAMRAATKMVVERDVHREAGFLTQSYLQNALPRAHMLDGRSGPKNLGYFGNAGRTVITPWNFRDFRDRPTVDTSDLNS